MNGETEATRCDNTAAERLWRVVNSVARALASRFTAAGCVRFGNCNICK